MADVAEDLAEEVPDVLEGTEPGASRNSVLLATDSYEDLSNYLSDQDISFEKQRSSSGTIKEIAKGDEEELLNHDGTNEVFSGENGQSKDADVRKISKALDHTDLGSDNEGTSAQRRNFGLDGMPDRATDTPTSETSQTSTDTESTRDVCDNIAAAAYIEDSEVDYVHSAEWRQHRKHVFVLSEAGKPIYSRHGEEDRLVTLMGVLQALVSFIQVRHDHIRCIKAGNHKFVFLIRDHLILVAVSESMESLPQILLQLTYVYNQILSVLTLSQLSRIFKQRRNYDLRRLLTGSEKFLDNLLSFVERDPSCFLGAVRCLPMDSSMRDTIAQTISNYAKVKDLVFAIFIADSQLITLVRMKKYFLHPLDIHLIFNLVSASESFKSAESWTPICLPKFDPSGYLHAHISYLDEACRACLLLLTVDKDLFFVLSECKDKIKERFLKYRCLPAIDDALRRQSYNIGQLGITDLRHFLYKSRSTAQYSSPAYTAPYNTEDERQRLFSLYQYLHHRIHNSARPLRILYHVGTHETLLGWVTSGFELYAVFGPLVTKSAAINSVNKLLKWIKKEEERLFILNAPTF